MILAFLLFFLLFVSNPTLAWWWVSPPSLSFLLFGWGGLLYSTVKSRYVNKHGSPKSLKIFWEFFNHYVGKYFLLWQYVCIYNFFKSIGWPYKRSLLYLLLFFPLPPPMRMFLFLPSFSSHERQSVTMGTALNSTVNLGYTVGTYSCILVIKKTTCTMLNVSLNHSIVST